MSSMIAIVDYKAGNLTSVLQACAAVGVAAEVTQDPKAIRSAGRIVFPGVGAAGASMAVLQERGLSGAVVDAVEKGTPFLGICVGTQILLDHSDEDGGVNMLGIISGRVKRFEPADPFDKVPQ